MTRITVAEAAKQLNIPQQAVRSMIRAGTLPIGFYKRKEERGAYYIFQEKLDAWANARRE